MMNTIDFTETTGVKDSSVVKQKKRFLKSVLKLDKNFHIYVHGNPEYIEECYDDKKQCKYLKLYYNEMK